MFPLNLYLFIKEFFSSSKLIVLNCKFSAAVVMKESVRIQHIFRQKNNDINKYNWSYTNFSLLIIVYGGWPTWSSEIYGKPVPLRRSSCIRP